MSDWLFNNVDIILLAVRIHFPWDIHSLEIFTVEIYSGACYPVSSRYRGSRVDQLITGESSRIHFNYTKRHSCLGVHRLREWQRTKMVQEDPSRRKRRVT